MISVQNTSKRETVTVILVPGVDYEHPDCAPHNTVRRVAVGLPDGTKGFREEQVSHPASLLWQPGETRVGLPEKIEEAPDFKAAVAAGKLRIDRK